MTDRPLLVELFSTGWQPVQSVQAPGPEPNIVSEHKALEAAGFAVESLTLSKWPLNFSSTRHSAFRGVDPVRSLRVLLTQRKAAIIRAHMECALVPLLLRSVFGFRPPIVIWEVPWSPGWRYREWVSRLTIPRADRAVVFSTNQIELIRNIYGRNLLSEFIPYYVDLNFFQPQPGASPSKVDPYILSAGIDGGRDFGILFDLSREINEKFVLKIKKNALPERKDDFSNIDFITDYLSHIDFRQLYADASMVVVSTVSTPNACGVTSLMEAMAMGKPTIISDNPALRDYLPPPDAGVVVPIGDREALRTAILELRHNPEKANAMGKKARAFAEQRFCSTVNLKAMTDLFWDIAEGAGTAIRQRAG